MSADERLLDPLQESSEQMRHHDGTGTRAIEPILWTKLHRPQLDAELVYRDRLIELMYRAREVPLILVSAPAGYGNSVLVAQWAEQLDSSAAWLSLDESDGDPRRGGSRIAGGRL